MNLIDVKYKHGLYFLVTSGGEMFEAKDQLMADAVCKASFDVLTRFSFEVNENDEATLVYMERVG